MLHILIFFCYKLMKIEVKSILKNCWLNIKNEQVINKIIWALKGRFEKYNYIWISRKEFEKFWVKEREMYLIIEDLKDLWLVKLVWYTKIVKSKYKVCVYELSSILKQIFWLSSISLYKRIYN